MNWLFTIFFLMFYLNLGAQTITQEVVSNGGGFYKQLNGSLQFTIAEPVSDTYKNNNSYLTQGFQQGNYNIVGLKENSVDQILTEIYPNPASDLLKIKVKDENADNSYDITITDLAGRLIEKRSTPSNTITEINLSAYANSSYLINISSSNNNYFKTYKIQKIN